MNGTSVNYLKFLITGDSSQLQAESGKARRTLTGMVDDIKGSFAGLGGLIAGVFAGVSVAGLVGKLVSVEREIGVLNSSLVTVTGSSAAASREMEWLKVFAKDTPYGLAQATEGFVKMQALGLDPTREKLTSFGNTASAMGKDLMQMIEAVADASTGEFERLKEFGIKASKQGEQITFTFQGVSTTVRNTSAEITSYLERIGNTSFAGAMDRRAKELDGVLAAMGDSWDELFRKINASTGFSKAAASGLTLVTDAIDGLGDAISKHQGLVMGVVGALGGAAAVAGLMAVGKALGVVTVALGALAAVAAANPLTLALLGIGAVVGVASAISGPKTGNLEGVAREIEHTSARIVKAEAQLAAAGGSRGAMTVQLEQRIAGMKRYRQELQTQQEALELQDPRNQSRYKTRTQSYADEAARQVELTAEADAELAEIRRNLYGVNKDYLPQLEKLHKMYTEGRITQADYVDMVSRLAKENYKVDEATKAGAQSAKQLQSAYNGLLDSIAEKTAEQRRELETGEALTEADKLRIKFAQDLLGPLKGLGAAERANVEAKIQGLEAATRETAARKRLLEQLEEERKRRIAVAQAAEQVVQGLIDGNKELAEEIELIGLTDAQQAEVLRKRQQAVILIKEQHLAELVRAEDAQGFMSRERIALEAEIELLQERLALTDQKTARTASAAASAASVAEWQKGIEQLGQSLTDQLMGGGQSFAAYLKNLARTLVFRPIIQAIIQPLLGGSAAGSVAGADAGILGRLSGGGGGLTDWSNWGSSSGDWLLSQSTKLGLNGMEGLGNAAFQLGDTIKGVDAWLKNIPGFDGGIGSAVGYLGAVYSLTQGNYGSAIGQAIGTWILPGIGTMIGGALGGLLDGMGSRGANHSGAAASSADGVGNDAAALQIFGTTSGDWYGDVTKRHNGAIESQLSDTVGALASVYSALAGYAGDAARQIDVVGAFAANGKYGDESAYGYGQIRDKLTGEVLAAFTNRDLGTDTAAGWTAFVGQLGGLVVEQLKATDIPGWMRSQLDAIGPDVTVDGLNAALQQIAAIDGAFGAWSETLVGFKDLSGEVQTALLNVSGGLEALGSNVSAFYSGFYTEAERAETLQRQVRAAVAELDLSIDPAQGEAAKLQFRAAVEAALAAGNGELAAQLLALSASFAAAADSAAAAAAEVAKAAEEAQKAARNQALANLEAAVERERTFWEAIADASQDAVSSLSSALSMLTSNARDLYGTVQSTQDAMAAQGMVYVEEALASVRRGGSVSDFGGLQDAITAARSGIASGVYATQFERERDALVLAGQLSALGELTGEQLTFEERQLRAANAQIEQLDQTLDYWRKLLNGTSDQIDATLTVTAAVQWLAQLMGLTGTDAEGGGTNGGGSGGGAVWGPGGGSSGGAADLSGAKYIRDKSIGSAGFVPTAVTDSAEQARLDGLAELMRGYSGSGDLAGLLAAAQSAGYRLTDVQAASTSVDPVWRGSTYEQWLSAAKGVGVGAFEDGGLHSGGLRLVGERGWELEATGPARLWNQGQLASALGGGGSADMEREIRVLRAQNERLERAMETMAEGMAKLVSNTNSLPKMGLQFETYSNGGQFSRSKAIAP